VRTLQDFVRAVTVLGISDSADECEYDFVLLNLGLLSEIG